ncbi:MAG: carotenoid 1,2-hydratase [Gammaproteobacteria bacterium]|nr:carotenoid 1,2-hydratase [Gammaproteobacteria bacterium]
MTAGGYCWWYLDAISDDGQHGLTLIAFIGSVFSPYYFRARRRDPGAAPEQHCAMNIAVYGRRSKRWAMTERGAGDLERDADRLQIGPSQLDWDGSRLRARFDEITVPLPSRLRGEVLLWPEALPGASFPLDGQQRHRWTPFAPCARVEVRLEQPHRSWTGHGYFDGNDGSEALELAFRDWNWSRATAADGSTTIYYDTRSRTAQRTANLALRFDSKGLARTLSPPPAVSLARSGWRMPRASRSEDSDIVVLATLEDTPFYSRSLLTTKLLGEPVTAMHESLSLDRFRQPVVQWMLPFRMPRWARRM